MKMYFVKETDVNATPETDGKIVETFRNYDDAEEFICDSGNDLLYISIMKVA